MLFSETAVRQVRFSSGRLPTLRDNTREEKFSESRMAATNPTLWGIHAGRAGDDLMLWVPEDLRDKLNQAWSTIKNE